MSEQVGVKIVRWVGLSGAMGALLVGCVIDPVPTPGDWGESTSDFSGPPSLSVDAGANRQEADADGATPGGADAWSRDEKDAGDNGVSGQPSPALGSSPLLEKILVDGGVPGPKAIDPLAFLGRHDLGESCNARVCLLSELRSSDDLWGQEGCTFAWMGLRTDVSATPPVRPPLHLVVALEGSAAIGESLVAIKAGLKALVKELSPGDRFSLVVSGTLAEVVVEAVELGASVQGDEGILKAIDDLKVKGGNNLYDGLFTAYDLLSKSPQLPGSSRRLLLIDRSAASAGLKGDSHLLSLVAGWAAKGIATSAVWLGVGVDPWLLRDIAEVGGGNFWVGSSPEDLDSSLLAEARTILVPVALDVHLEVETGAGWNLDAVRGPSRWKGSAAGGELYLPLLNVAGLAAGDAAPATPAGTGWRGAAQGLSFALRRPIVASAEDHVLRIKLRWRHPETGLWEDQEVTLKGPAGDGTLPMKYDSGAGAAKAWLVTALQLGLEAAAVLVEGADTGNARAVLKTLRLGLSEWLKAHPSHLLDSDLAEDIKLIQMFEINTAALSNQSSASILPGHCPGI